MSENAIRDAGRLACEPPDLAADAIQAPGDLVTLGPRLRSESARIGIDRVISAIVTSFSALPRSANYKPILSAYCQYVRIHARLNSSQQDSAMLDPLASWLLGATHSTVALAFAGSAALVYAEKHDAKSHSSASVPRGPGHKQGMWKPAQIFALIASIFERRHPAIPTRSSTTSAQPKPRVPAQPLGPVAHWQRVAEVVERATSTARAVKDMQASARAQIEMAEYALDRLLEELAAVVPMDNRATMRRQL